MTVTVAQIRTEFPEFVNTDSGLIQGKINDATGYLNAGAFGEDYDQAVKYFTCHLICLSPSGEFARLDANEERDGATSTYERHFMKLMRAIVAPMVV